MYTYTYIFFISIVLIRLYSNNAFKASAAILSDDTTGTCNMISRRRKEEKEQINIAKTEGMNNFKR